ncbi:TraB/GumN family protein [Roseovarius sp. 2305UL8-3]|uniref:TraB/GumN family protein n=1 Tax=Roseovarius conchicola TaxID=3121636 RepID=UPI0035277ED3
MAALPAEAQSWATPEVCFPKNLEVYEDTLTPFTLDDLQAAAQAIPNAAGRYWRVTSPEGAVSHLWGTMHVNDPRLLDLPDQVLGDIRAARAVALEADFIFTTRDDYTSWARADNIIRSDGLPSRFGLLGLPDDVNAWIRDRTEGLAWGADAPDYLTLAGLAQLILGDPCADFAGGVYPNQDSLIQTLGAIEGAEIIGLESPEDFLNTLSDPQNFNLTRAMIGVYGAYLNPTRTADSTATGYALYLQGQTGVSMLLDRAYIMAIYGEDQGRDWLELTNGYLLDDRNQTFVASALPELNQGGVFIAVGNFHLPGEDGMIELLRGEGFRVERVALPGEVAE